MAQWPATVGQFHRLICDRAYQRTAFNVLAGAGVTEDLVHHARRRHFIYLWARTKTSKGQRFSLPILATMCPIGTSSNVSTFYIKPAFSSIQCPLSRSRAARSVLLRRSYRESYIDTMKTQAVGKKTNIRCSLLSLVPPQISPRDLLK